MYEMDKAKFGAFVAQLRKEQGMTQKDLAQKLYISDKAVSKWETGVNTPDVALLIPLAELLGVTVTELLECRRMEVQPPIEEIVKKAVRYSERGEKDLFPHRKRLGVLLAAGFISVLQLLLIFHIAGGYTGEMTALLVMELMGVVFGCYFWLFARETLPMYYDENRISAYSDGFFRMNLTGVAINNRNWPHILRVGRLWTIALLDLYPVLFFVGTRLLGAAWPDWGETTLMVLFLLSLVVPIYIVGKKYE